MGPLKCNHYWSLLNGARGWIVMRMIFSDIDMFLQRGLFYINNKCFCLKNINAFNINSLK